LNSAGSASIGASLFNNGVINYDVGNHSMSASYAGDASFAPSSSTQPVTFTITPGFAGVSGPTSVTIATPGGQGTSAVGLIGSTGFGAVSFGCPAASSAEIACSGSITPNGPNNVMNGTFTVTTMGPHTTALQRVAQPYYFAAILGGGLPLAGIFLLVGPKRRRSGVLCGLLLLAALVVTLPACGGGGGGGHHQDPGTPPGTYNVTVIATSGSLSAQATFTLTVQ
jgi:hypothetical protein